MKKKFHFYFDETGTRKLSLKHANTRQDNMNCFGFGGILVEENNIEIIRNNHKTFYKKWNLQHPLHSTEIRGKSKNFEWLRNEPHDALEFFQELNDFILTQPFVAFACIIDKNGYFNRYSREFESKLWDMERTTFNIMIERVVKWVNANNGELKISFEEIGRKEDKILKTYLDDLKLNDVIYQKTIVNSLTGVKKQNEFTQLADLCLYPIAKSGYVPDYQPFIDLSKNMKLIDCYIQENDKDEFGIKFLFFDD